MPHHRSLASNQEHWQEQAPKKPRMYEQPEGPVVAFIWRLWMKLKTTFALSMMEPWEILLIFVITGITTLLVTVGLVRYFPHAIVTASRRAHYYLSGSDGVSAQPDTLKAAF